MIDGISNGMMPTLTQTNRSNSSLTDDQKQLISDTLESFDANNLTEADAQSIIETFNEAGIQPGRALTEAMSEQGFNAREVGETAGIQGPTPSQGMGPPPGQNNNEGLKIDQESLEALSSLLDQFLNDDMSEEERKSAVDTIRNTLVPEEGLFSDNA